MWKKHQQKQNHWNKPTLFHSGFNPFTPSPISTSVISKSPQVRFLFVWSSLIYFPVHQLAATNYMHLHSNYTPYLQHIQSEAHLESSRIFGVELFCGNSQARWLFLQKSSIVDLWQDSKCDSVQKFSSFISSIGDIPPKCLATFPGMFEDILWNFWRHSLECLGAFFGMFGDISWNVWRHFPKCLTTFLGMFEDITRNVW